MSLADPRRKMSKTGGVPAGTISLVDPPDVIARKVRRAVTDSGTEVRGGEDKPALTNLIAIHALLAGLPPGEVEVHYAGRGYAAFKAELAELLVEKLRPLREAYARWLADPALLEALLAEGSARAAELAARTMRLVEARTGLGRPRRPRAAAGLPADGGPGLSSRSGEPSPPSR
jgi:tryptophanyl-tRNA synthetase